MTVSVTTVKRASICAPVQAHAIRDLGLLADECEVRAQLVNNALAFQVPNLDARLSRGTQPVPVRAEAKRVDNITGIQRVQPLALRQIPQHGDTILASAGAQGAIRRHRHGVHIASVPDQVGPNLAVGEVPHLHDLVPPGGHNDRVRRHGREPDAAHPPGMRIHVLDGVLALAERVPQLDRLVAGSRHNLPVVHRKRHAEHILGVADEAPGGGARVQVPQTQSAVPGARERELAVGGDDDVLDEVRVAREAPAREAVVALLARERPDDDALVARRREDEVRVVERARDGRHPVGVALQGSAQHQSFCHGLVMGGERGRGCE
jgi:hypothetical protein